MKKMQGAHRVAATAILVIVASLAIAACGSSSKPTTTTTTSTTSTTASAGRGAFTAQRAKLDACLKAHGVTLPSRPAGSGRPYGGAGGYGGGGFFGGGGGAGFAGGNSKSAKAFQACASQVGSGAGRFGGRFRGRASFSKTTLTAFVACVKKNGYTLPAPNTSGKGPVFPASIEKNKQFEAAAKSCESILRTSFRPPAGAAGAGGAAGTTSTGGSQST